MYSLHASQTQNVLYQHPLGDGKRYFARKSEGVIPYELYLRAIPRQLTQCASDPEAEMNSICALC